MKPVLTYAHVDVSFNGDAVVHDVSFSLMPGEILGIVGESGSGKSTLLRAAMGLLGPTGLVTRGDIWFRPGRASEGAGSEASGSIGALPEPLDIPDLSGEDLRRVRGAGIGMVFQDAGASFVPIRTIGAQIVESLRAHGDKRGCGRVSADEARKRALALFERLGFEEPERIWKSYPFELSGGMSQRAGIAIAMLLQPRVLLADEPTSALDVAVQKQVIRELKSLRDLFGTSIVVVTHDIGVIEAMADSVLVMKEGHVVEHGPADRVLRHPEHEYTKRLLAAVPRLRRSPRAGAEQEMGA